MARALSALRRFYRFLNLHHGVEVNPARAASMPKLEKRLPGYLDRGAMARMFALAEARAADGAFRSARDRAILELFYSTGMRLSELVGLDLDDVDLVADQARVRGKGKKERLLPVGRPAVTAVRHYYPGGTRCSRRGKRPRAAGGVPQRAGPAADGAGGAADRAPVLDAVSEGAEGADALAAPFVRDAPARRRRGPAGGAGAAGPRVAVHDADLHAHERASG